VTLETKTATGRVRDGADRTTLGRTAAWLARQVEVGLVPADLSLPQYRVLGLLDESSAVSSDLAARLAIRPPSVTAVIDGLVARGLVERRPVDGDRRLVDHLLTESGRAALDKADQAVNARLEDILAHADKSADRVKAFDGLFAWRRVFGCYLKTRKMPR
jgi:long-chain acyl-CoA synthetase